MHRQKTVSVVIPTIGRATLAVAIDSVLRQSRPVDEVMIINDSQDQAPQGPQLTAVVTEIFTGGGVGAGAAKQIGLETATTDLVAFLDDDDFWLPHHIRAAVVAFDKDTRLDLYAARVFMAHPESVTSNARVCFRGKQRLIDFYYGPFCFAGRRRSLPPTTWVCRQELSELHFESFPAMSKDIWWMICHDERGRKIWQSSSYDAVWYEDSDRTIGRYSMDSLGEYAALLEGVRVGAGCRFLIGEIGRLYARGGMKKEWQKLMSNISPDLVLTRGYSQVRQLERLLLVCSALRVQDV
jgi:glycosyltransferase involved in cell wall biosynthesis